MTGNSQIPKDILLNNLKELMPEIFSEGKVDWERLKVTLGEDINFSKKGTSLTGLVNPMHSGYCKPHPPEPSFRQKKNQSISTKPKTYLLKAKTSKC